MTRRLLTAIFSPILLAAQKRPRQRKYAVTFPHRNGCFVDPIWVEADSRIEALHNCGATVWTDAEWEDAMKLGMRESMDKHRCGSVEEKDPKR